VAQVVTTFRERGDGIHYCGSRNSGFPATLQYLAPYTGASLAEYLCIVNDTLQSFMMISPNKHKLIAKCLFYYEDHPAAKLIQGCFYLHSRLLERAAKLSSQLGEEV